MYECPGCGQGLKFDIDSQQLHCEYCGNYYDPDDYERSRNSENFATYDANVFVCNQCGGEFITPDEGVSTFCSYCGAPNIVGNKLTGIKRPEYMISFKINKDKCKEAYLKRTRKAIYTPREFKDPEFLDRFRGLYVPYWIYDFAVQGTVKMKGKKSERHGDYVTTYTAEARGAVDATYTGISFDASSTFDDDLAAQIAPYDFTQVRPFNPTILSGFYADTEDVPSEVYLDDTAEMVAQEVATNFSKELTSAGYVPNELKADAFGKQLPLFNKTPKGAMFPVWFLSYKKGNKVAYAVVNGVNGKMACDLPISFGKFFFGTAIVTVAVFALLNFIIDMTAPVSVVFTAILSVIMCVLCIANGRSLREKATREDDEGYMYKQGRLSEMDIKDKASRKIKNAKPRKTAGAVFATIVTIISLFILMGTGLITLLGYLMARGFFEIIVGVILLLVGIVNLKNCKKTFYIINCITLIIAGIVLAFHPVSDMYYYGSALAIIVTMILSGLEMFKVHNELTLRPLPQLSKEGGRERDQ